jgi:pilus assembly protein CpaB
MKNKSMMLLMVAAGCGLVAMFGVQQMLSGGKPANKVRILVARSDIDAGIKLDQTNVGFKEWPAEQVPPGAIKTEEEFAERALKHRVGPGAPILTSELGNKGEFGLEIQIPADMRMVSLPVTATMTHSGLLRPGNYVDVSAVIETPVKGGGKKTEVKPVLQCIQVFAVGSRVAGTEESKDPKAAEVKNVSFLVYPLQGQLLQLAHKLSNANLQLAMRSGSDKSLANTRDLTDESLSSMSKSLIGSHEDSRKSEPVAAATTPTAKPKSAFQSYLAPETPTAMTSVGDQAVRRTWQIVVFQGDQREVQEIDWPEDKPASTDSSKAWSNPLMKFFDRREKPEKAPVKAQSTTLIRRDNTSTAGEDEKDRDLTSEKE